jgi:hypothetical protein
MLRTIELKGNRNMKLAITLGDADIKAALVAHAKQALKIDLSDDQVSVEITAGRKGKGYSAEIVIGGDTETGTSATALVEPVSPEEEVELPKPTPETAGHESTSLFDQ